MNGNDQFKKDSFSKFLNILSTYNQSSLVSTSETKFKLDIFLNTLSKLNISIQSNEILELNTIIDIEQDSIKLSWDLRRELGVKTDMDIENKIIIRNKERNSKVAF